MSKNEKILSIQNTFLESVKESKKVVEIHLINGVLLKCKVLNIDNFALLVDLNKKKTLIYKHSIAYIK
ncbi:MAG: RNA chaperone Hfq [Alphaproteobacteria bacterium TMED194]|nr:MAG: RNA chaperone Hfq [Alphaproteobacteria bacterium TMED194]